MIAGRGLARLESSSKKLEWASRGLWGFTGYLGFGLLKLRGVSKNSFFLVCVFMVLEKVSLYKGFT